MTNDLKWNEKSHSYVSKGFMRLERLDLYMNAIKDEVKKHLDIWYIIPSLHNYNSSKLRRDDKIAKHPLCIYLSLNI